MSPPLCLIDPHLEMTCRALNLRLCTQLLRTRQCGNYSPVRQQLTQARSIPPMITQTRAILTRVARLYKAARTLEAVGVEAGADFCHLGINSRLTRPPSPSPAFSFFNHGKSRPPTLLFPIPSIESN